jgi:hypothetical protein
MYLQSRVHDRFLELVKSYGFNAYLLPLLTNVYAIISRIILDKVMERSKNAKGRPRIYIEYLWLDKSFSIAGALTFIDDGICVTGGVNIYRDVAWGIFHSLR